MREITDIVKGEQLPSGDTHNDGKYYHLNGGINPSSRTDKHNVNANTISISEGGNSCGYVNWNAEPFFSGGHNYTLQEIVESISPYFLYEALKNKQSEIMSLRVGSGLPNIQKKDIEMFSIYVPHIAEQKRIADFFYYIDSKIRIQQHFIEYLKKYKRGVISTLLGSKDNPYYSLETWREVALCDVASGFEYGMNAAATIYDGVHKYIRITDIDDNSHLYIQEDPVSPKGQVDEKYRVRENDILFARTGASVGKSYCYQITDGALYYAGFLIRIHVNSDVDSGYIFQNTLTEMYKRWVRLESARSGQPGINAEQYKQYRFLLPPLKLQNKISALSNKFDDLIYKEEKLLSLIEQAKNALLQQLFI